MPHKLFEGNNPETVKPGADGSLKLSAQNCAIYGSSLIFEKPYANLGYWSNVDDYAVWTVVLPKAGRYEVWLDYAWVKNGTAGNTLVLQAGDEKVTGKVAGTGTWDDYKQAQIGTLGACLREEATISDALGGDRFAGETLLRSESGQAGSGEVTADRVVDRSRRVLLIWQEG